MGWNLNVDNFTWLDRLKVAAFILNRRNRLTMGNKVKEFEAAFSDFASSYALYVSSGSTANTLLAESYKQLHGNEATVFVPTTTWATSINPWMQAGFKIKFVDINIEDLSISLAGLETALAHTEGPKIVFPTSLIGFVPDMDKLGGICKSYGATLMMDNCENTFGTYKGESLLGLTTCTTSTYFGHHLSSIEGGFLFTRDHQLYMTAKMVRNHGMTRSLGGEQREDSERKRLEAESPSIDPLFLFARMGFNFRNTEINAMFGLLDFARRDEYKKKRRELYDYFYKQIDHELYLAPSMEDTDREHVPFCLPLICNNASDLPLLKSALTKYEIEYRPIVGGNLLAQPIYQAYADDIRNSVSRMVHNRGLYVGLHNKMSFSHINALCDIANNLND